MRIIIDNKHEIPEIEIFCPICSDDSELSYDYDEENDLLVLYCMECDFRIAFRTHEWGVSDKLPEL